MKIENILLVGLYTTGVTLKEYFTPSQLENMGITDLSGEFKNLADKVKGFKSSISDDS